MTKDTYRMEGTYWYEQNSLSDIIKKTRVIFQDLFLYKIRKQRKIVH